MTQASARRSPLAIWLLAGALIALATILVFVLPQVWGGDPVEDETGDAKKAAEESGLLSGGTGSRQASRDQRQQLKPVAADPGRPDPDPEPDPGEGSLTVRVVDKDTAAPVHGVAVVVWRRDGSAPASTARRGVTDSTGRVLINGLQASEHRVRLDRDWTTTSVRIRRDKQSTITVQLGKGFSLRGKVVDATGAPVPGASIWIHAEVPSNNMLAPGVPVTRCDHEGRYVLERVTSSFWFGARAPLHAPSRLFRHVKDKPPPDGELTLHLRGPAARLEGSVHDVAGPVVGAKVLITYGYRPVEAAGTWGHTADAPVEVRTDRHGRFQFDDLTPGRVQLEALAKGRARVTRDLDLRAGVNDEVKIQLADEASLVGQARTTDGRPIAEAYLRIGRLRTRSNTQGLFRFRNLPPGKVTLNFFARGYTPFVRTTELPAGEVTRLDIEVQALPEIRGRVLDESGKGLSGWRVYVEKIAGPGAYDARYGTSGPDGSFTVALQKGNRYHFALREPGMWIMMKCPRFGVVTAGQDPVDLVVSDRERATAFVTLSVQDSQGKLRSAFLTISDGDVRATPGVTMPATKKVGDRVRLGPLPPKTYKVGIQSEDGSFPSFQTDEFQLKPRQHLDLGVVRVPNHGWVDYKFTALANVDFTAVAVEFQDDGGVMDLGGLFTVKQGGAGRWALLPGKYRVILFGDEIATMERTLQVRTGKATKMVEELKRGVRVTVQAKLPKGEKSLQCKILDGHGTCAAWELRLDRSYTQNYNLTLPVGWLTIEATGANGRRYQQRFEVTSKSRQQIQVDFEARK